MAYGNARAGFYVNNSYLDNFTGNTAHGNLYGIGIESSGECRENYQNSYDNVLSNEHYYSNGADLWVVSIPDGTTVNLSNVVLDNPLGNFQNFTNLSISDSVGSGESYSINWSQAPAALPDNYSSFAQKFINVTILSGSPSIDFLACSWNDDELIGYDESLFSLWMNNDSGWSSLNDTPDVVANELSVSGLSGSGTLGILQAPS